MFESRKNIVIAAVSFLILLILGGGAYYLYLQPIKKTAPPEVPLPIGLSPVEQKQAEELDSLRQSAGQKPLTEAEIKKQSEELNSLRQQVSNPPSAQNVSGQASEIDKLRAQSQP